MKLTIAAILLFSFAFIARSSSHSLESKELLNNELKRAKRDWSWEDIKSKVVDYSKAAVDVVKTTGTKIKDATVDAYENRGEIYANAKESVSNFGSKVSNKTKEIYENRGEIYENTKEGLSNFGQKVANTTKDVYEKITD